MDRRRFLQSAGVMAVMPWQTPSQTSSQTPAQPQLPGAGQVGTLREPGAVGRPRTPTVPHENEAEIQRVEQRLACTCGCTLDIFTCRTTDFTCTYSPELHREVLAYWSEGKRGQEIIDAFVAKYGEKALMAPKPEGFNLAGYFVPGTLILLGSGALFAVLRRRRKLALAGATSADPAVPLASNPDATPDELERLRRALAETDD
jgi:cytochrome c-type biogenesis protein CcmH